MYDLQCYRKPVYSVMQETVARFHECQNYSHRALLSVTLTLAVYIVIKTSHKLIKTFTQLYTLARIRKAHMYVPLWQYTVVALHLQLSTVSNSTRLTSSFITSPDPTTACPTALILIIEFSKNSCLPAHKQYFQKNELRGPQRHMDPGHFSIIFLSKLGYWCSGNLK